MTFGHRSGYAGINPKTISVMSQENDYENYEEEPEEFEEFESDDQVTVAPPLEGPIAKYMREYRLLNSLLISL
ncbi:MAG: hypothetical protein CMI33_01130, partial [Opitutales bacterium]|nr:hypothetical protein [Opitutales bacterium]